MLARMWLVFDILVYAGILFGEIAGIRRGLQPIGFGLAVDTAILMVVPSANLSFVGHVANYNYLFSYSQRND
jgi:hypothetical protein